VRPFCPLCIVAGDNETFERIVPAPSAAAFLLEGLAGSITPVRRVETSARQMAEWAQAPFHRAQLAVLFAQVMAMDFANRSFKPW